MPDEKHKSKDDETKTERKYVLRYLNAMMEDLSNANLKRVKDFIQQLEN